MNSTQYLAISEASLHQKGGYWTAKEIAQQADTLKALSASIDDKRHDLEQWLAPVLAQSELRVILTGAGTSAYIGQALAPVLTQTLNRRIEAIATTDLVSEPQQYLLAHTPTLLVSFARSGSSPESIGAVKLANQIIDKCYHLFITCDPQGELALMEQHPDRHYCLLMPPQTLDNSFAMTSSFTAMMLAALEVFSPDATQRQTMLQTCQGVLHHSLSQAKLLAEKPFKRIVFLGSGGLKGIATEAALKMLELSAGKIDCYCESPLGFRHGPKSIIDKDTLVLMLSSLNPYTMQYEADLIKELENDRQTRLIYQLGHPELKDAWLAFPYIIFCQALAFYKALDLAISPDNPCPSGEVNRVVKGVTIYPYLVQ